MDTIHMSMEKWRTDGNVRGQGVGPEWAKGCHGSYNMRSFQEPVQVMQQAVQLYKKTGQIMEIGKHFLASTISQRP